MVFQGGWLFLMSEVPLYQGAPKAASFAKRSALDFLPHSFLAAPHPTLSLAYSSPPPPPPVSLSGRRKAHGGEYLSKAPLAVQGYLAHKKRSPHRTLQ